MSNWCFLNKLGNKSLNVDSEFGTILNAFWDICVNISFIEDIKTIAYEERRMKVLDRQLFYYDGNGDGKDKFYEVFKSYGKWMQLNKYVDV